MKGQAAFSDIESAARKRTTKRERFLRDMDAAIPWDALVALARPHCFGGGRGRRPVGAGRTPRTCFPQLWFNLSDEAAEDAIHGPRAFSELVGVSFGAGDQAPDATTLLKFRRMVGSRGLGRETPGCAGAALERKGATMRGGPAAGAAFVEAPSPAKNAKKERDPETPRAKKGGDRRFGLRAHIGAGAGSGPGRAVEAAAADVSDIAATHKLVREDDAFRCGGSGCAGVAGRPEVVSDENLAKARRRIARRPSAARGPAAAGWEREIESRKASAGGKAARPFLTARRQFGWAKARCRGLAENGSLMCALFALANVAMWARAGRPDPPAGAPA